jgi:LCP family protein required for cell wall assembly
MDPKPTRSQTATEYVLFSAFGLLLVLVAIAVYTMYSPSHRRVPNRVAIGIRQDRLNILVFGIGGTNHPTGDDLADSIVLISLKPSTRQAVITSIPRDLWVKIGPYGTHRINYAHEVGNQSGYPGEGPGLLCDTVARILGQPIHAFVRVDFSAFEKIVDDVGGVDINCQRGFYDFLFRDGFQAGPHHLNGKRALAFARYRYILGPEGDNFAREMRQQQVISALRDKLRWLGPQQAMSLIHAVTTLSSHTTTNLTTSQMFTLYREFHDVPQQHIRHVSLKPFLEIFTVTRISEPGQAVRSRTDGYRELQTVLSNVFHSEQQIGTPDEIKLTAKDE